MRRAFRKDEMPYPADNTIRGTISTSLQRAQGGAGVRSDFHTSNQRKHQENKAQNLMPERMHGLYSGRNNVLDELSGLPRQMLLWHDFIVSKANACTGVRLACTIKGIFVVGRGHGTDGPVVASQ